jgi:hypothetical protein
MALVRWNHFTGLHRHGVSSFFNQSTVSVALHLVDRSGLGHQVILNQLRVEKLHRHRLELSRVAFFRLFAGQLLLRSAKLALNAEKLTSALPGVFILCVWIWVGSSGRLVP